MFATLFFYGGDEWYGVKLANNKTPNDYDVSDWLKDNIDSMSYMKAMYHSNVLYFSHKEDAMLFELIWGN